MNAPTIRLAGPEDAPTILAFIRELATYEKAGDEVVAGEDDIRESIFGTDATAHALIAEDDGAPIGFAVYFFNYSTWQGCNGLYLEDLYVTPARRGTGAGTALLRHLARIALKTGCGRFEWSVLDWNEPAIGFYDAIGAEPQREWIRYRLDRAGLERFAQA